MKNLICVILFLQVYVFVWANNPYRNYLLTRIQQTHQQAPFVEDAISTISPIPKYQIPKGAIFCRMEDKVTRTTRVWLKIGVQ